MPDLLVTTRDRVRTLTLNRPERRNALSAELVHELVLALEAARDDDDVRVVVLEGAGGVFCSGGDLSAMGQGAPETDDAPRRGFVDLNLALVDVRKPVIAKVRRYAYGGGLGLVAAATFAVAEDTAVFGTPEIDRGLFPMMIMANLLRNVPRRRGLEMLLLGDRVDAEQAVASGIVNRAVPADALDAEVDALADRLARKPPEIVRLGLEAFHAQGDMALRDALPYLEDMLHRCFGTADAREGLAAFLEKRAPEWG